jgi:hypothetical protein
MPAHRKVKRLHPEADPLQSKSRTRLAVVRPPTAGGAHEAGHAPGDAAMSASRVHHDRAAVVATAIAQIISQIRPPELWLRVEQLLRDEFADTERQVVADRSDD